MIIPVVTRDLIYFSKLESLISPEHRMIQIKNIEDIDKLDFANERTIFIADLNDELINELLNRKDKISVVAYYPHVMKRWMQWSLLKMYLCLGSEYLFIENHYCVIVLLQRQMLLLR